MATEARPSLKSDMTSLHLLKLPGEIRNNIYRHVLCYDGIKPEVRSAWSPWEPWDLCTGPCNVHFPHSSRHGSCSNFDHERSSLRMQLDVIVPVRRGFYPRTLPPVSVNYVLNILRTCRQIYEEAHAIFWAENAFVFSSELIMSRFVERISDKAFELIRTLGVETRVDTELVIQRGSSFQKCCFTEVPPFLQQPGRSYEWKIKVDEYDCLRDDWVTNCSNPPELKITKNMIRCKTIYSWLTRLSTTEARLTTHDAGATNNGSHDLCVPESPSIRRCLTLSEALARPQGSLPDDPDPFVRAAIGNKRFFPQKRFFKAMLNSIRTAFA